MRWTWLAVLLLIGAPLARSAEPSSVVVFHQPKTFAGWPANGGLWTWDNGQEALVAFVTGDYVLRNGHNLKPPFTNRLARTTDGGQTWKLVDARGFFQPGDPLQPFKQPIDFTTPNLALRVVAQGYHAGSDQGPGLAVSRDRGTTWQGPFQLPPILTPEQAQGFTEITARTDYLVQNKDELWLIGSSRQPGRSGTDRTWSARLKAGGKEAEFQGWIVGPESKNRGLMSATIAREDKAFYTAIRQREPLRDRNWIGGYLSRDAGRTWTDAGEIGSTGTGNGNPPALLRLRDGRLACAYGDRQRKQMLLRLSADGTTWGREMVLRADYQPAADGETDLGYPRLFQRPDGAVVVVYYWSSRLFPTEHIAATIWTPE